MTNPDLPDLGALAAQAQARDELAAQGVADFVVPGPFGEPLMTIHPPLALALAATYSQQVQAAVAPYALALADAQRTVQVQGQALLQIARARGFAGGQPVYDTAVVEQALQSVVAAAGSQPEEVTP